MAPVDINLAAPERIMLLRGIGRVNAARIIAGRPFDTNYDLVTRNIISENIYEKIAADLTETPGPNQSGSARRTQSGTSAARCHC
jgi:hypothetical protein